jgi:enolase
MPLYRYFSGGGGLRIPMPLFQILNAGAHARGGIELQDFTIIPCGARSLMEAYEIAWSIYDEVRKIIVERGDQPVVGDEGGLSPPMDSIEEAFGLVMEGIERAGHTNSRRDIAMGMDFAASDFWDEGNGTYNLESMKRTLQSDEWVDLLTEWAMDYHILSLEDPMGEDDWEGWKDLTSRIGGQSQIIGDDLLVTNMDRLERAIQGGNANAILVKPNQAGTMTAAINATRRAKEAGFAPVISARSGETCDTTIADLAVGLDAGQLKLGSHIGSGRTSKYNRLFEIEAEEDIPYAGVSALAFNLR